MTLAIILVVTAILCSAGIGIGVYRGAAGRESGSTIFPVDLEAFRNLIDPAESEYLRQRLPAREFRRVQRKRLQAAAAYVQTVGQNANLLVRMGQSAMNTADQAANAAAQQMVDEALQLRTNVLWATLRIRIAWVWPTSGLAATPIADSYNRLSTSAMLLGRLQTPATAVRIAIPR